jgi:hypothetical protein
MNLSEILSDLYRRLNYATTPDTTVTTRLTAFVNETQQEILSEPGMESLLNDQVTFASVASTPEYSLPPVVSRLKMLRETTNDRVIQGPKSLGWYRAAYPDPTAVTGTPDSFVDLGVSAVAVQPSNASELFVLSTSASDGASKTAFVEGYITGGYYRASSVALNGITAASLSAAITTWIQVTKFYIALTAGGVTTAAGNVTLLEDSGIGTELARIPIGDAYASYRRIALAPCPSAAITYSLDFDRDATDLVQLTDEPIIPLRFHRLLGLGARMREYEKTTDSRYPQAQEEYLFGLKKLKFFLYSQTAGSPNLRGSMTAPRSSRLGGWFPADSW